VTNLKNYLTLFAFGLITACSIAETDKRYRDTTELERPPEVIVDPKSVEAAAANTVDAPRRRNGKGLKSDVYRVEDSSQKLRIKRPYDESWLLVNQVLQLHELKITDQDRSSGVYYIEFNGNGLLSFFSGTAKAPTYLVKLEIQGEETEITVSKANKEEQNDSSSNKDGVESSEDGSESLTSVLFDSLHDEVKED
jgi:NlpB/DapX lipoprotein